MSQEVTQGISPPPEGLTSAIAGVGVGNEVENSEGSHRILINDPPSRKSHPTSPTLASPKLRRVKSNNDDDNDDYDDDDDDDNDDDDDDDYDSDDPRKRNKRKGLRRRMSYRRRKSSIAASHVEDDSIDDESRNDLKARQDAINSKHPFGLPIWKPALYKKSRSIIRNADLALHLKPSSDLHLSFGNMVWAVCFGWWLAALSLAVSIILYLTPFGGWKYATVLRELSYYIFWPFGKFVEKIDNDADYEQQTDYFNHREDDTEEENNNENRPLLGIRSRRNSHSEKFNLFETLDEIGPSGVVFYFLFFLILAPTFLLVSTICWFLVFSIPMAKLTSALLNHLRKHPLSLHFKSGSSQTASRSIVLLCTDKAFGKEYYKYTYDGINIVFINLMPIVIFAILDDRFLKEKFPKSFIATEEFIFTLSVASVIPLSYFIGTAVASISAQSSTGVGAVINATFGSIIEIILYAIALNKGKGKLTEGSIIGSFMAGVLLMPGVSMISGGLKRKEQKFNAKSAGVTSTMLIMAIIGTLTPTLFFQTYAPYKMICKPCDPLSTSCQVCEHSIVEPTETALYKDCVKPLMFVCAVILLLSYLIGLWFSLNTHASLVYSTPQPRPHSIYQRLVPINILQSILPQSIISHQQHGLNPLENNVQLQNQNPVNPINPGNPGNPAITPIARPMSAPSATIPSQNILIQHNDNTINPINAFNSIHLASLQNPQTPGGSNYVRNANELEEEEQVGGHDSPNWSKSKSGIVLLACTVAFSFIAEILVENVKFVLEHVSVTEKFLGLTLFALIPNVTEFLNAMLFALYGNIALSMEIGSAYALQVCLLQIPAMVVYSAWLNYDYDQIGHTFTLVFPRWDVFSVVFSVFLLTYTYIEGKSNYFKGSILILSYLVLMSGFYFAPDNKYDSYSI